MKQKSIIYESPCFCEIDFSLESNLLLTQSVDSSMPGEDMIIFDNSSNFGW